MKKEFTKCVQWRRTCVEKSSSKLDIFYSFNFNVLKVDRENLQKIRFFWKASNFLCLQFSLLLNHAFLLHGLTYSYFIPASFWPALRNELPIKQIWTFFIFKKCKHSMYSCLYTVLESIYMYFSVQDEKTGLICKKERERNFNFIK